MVKKWEQFIINEADQKEEDRHQEFLNTLDTEKYKYFLVILTKGNFKDAEQLEGQISDFHKIFCDTTRTTFPTTIFYSYEWIVNPSKYTKKDEKGLTPIEFRNIVKDEADNLGIDVRIITHEVSEYDFETDNDIPEKYQIDTPNIYKKMNED